MRIVSEFRGWRMVFGLVCLTLLAVDSCFCEDGLWIDGGKRDVRNFFQKILKLEIGQKFLSSEDLGAYFEVDSDKVFLARSDGRRTEYAWVMSDESVATVSVYKSSSIVYFASLWRKLADDERERFKTQKNYLISPLYWSEHEGAKFRYRIDFSNLEDYLWILEGARVKAE